MVKSTVSKQCVVYLEQVCQLKRFYVYDSIVTLHFFLIHKKQNFTCF